MRITDPGLIVPREALPSLFEPFFPVAGRPHGNGIELAVLKAIARRFGGEVSAEIAPQGGTTIRVVLKGLPSPEAPLDDSPGAASEQAPGPAAEPLAVLIADGDAGSRRAMAKLLAREGFSVLEASDGEEACELFSRNGISVGLVILGDVMPRMGGRAALARMRARMPQLPAILCTGHSWGLDALRGEREGDFGVLGRPWLPRELLRQVRDRLGSCGARREA
jgi:two-component system cell cycle sensor histidine kinase/response regulator CckA